MNAPTTEAYEVYYRRGRLRVTLFLVITGLLLFFVHKIGVEEEVFGLQLRGKGYHMIRDAGVPIAGGLFLFALVQWANAMFRREMTLYGDPDGLTLLAGSRDVGPFAWSEIAKVDVLSMRGWNALHILFHKPDQSLTPYKGRLGKYRNLMIRSPHLLLAPNLLNTSVRRAARELETMRQLYS